MNLIKVLALAMFMLIPTLTINSSITEEDTVYKTVRVGDRIIQFDTTKVHMHDSIVDMLIDKPKLVELKRKGVKLSSFKDKMGVLESGNNYLAKNKYGYLGKYQFSKRTLRRLVDKGYLEATRVELRNFRNNPALQERAMNALITHNTEILLNGYKLGKYIGRTVGGVKITMEGLLAASHLLGPYSVSHFVKNNGSLDTVVVKGVTVRKYDGNGTSIIDYLNHFT